MENQQQQPGFSERFYRAFAPIGAGLFLDFVDLATFGPMGIFLGPFLGTAVGFWLSSFYRFSMRTKIILSLLAGLYCMVPMTEFIPIATLVCAACRFFEKPPAPGRPDDPENRPRRKFVESKTD